MMAMIVMSLCILDELCDLIVPSLQKALADLQLDDLLTHILVFSLKLLDPLFFLSEDLKVGIQLIESLMDLGELLIELICHAGYCVDYLFSHIILAGSKLSYKFSFHSQKQFFEVLFHRKCFLSCHLHEFKHSLCHHLV